MFTQTAHAQTASGASAGAGEPDSQIVVTGTRRTDRTVTDSAVPIDVLSANELASAPSSDMNNILRQMVPSFNVGRFIGVNADGSGFVRPPTLRGLPPDEILVLVNGKRFHRSALVQFNGGALASGAQGADLAQIPTIALERIEVLRDGASAQYGSDAIAGVINYTLRRNSSGLDIRTRYGQFYKGDGRNYQAQANLGLKLGETGFLNVSGEFSDAGYTSRGGQRIGAYAVSLARPDLKTENPAQIMGDPKNRSYRLFINGGFDLTDSSQLYFFGNYGLGQQTFRYNYRQPVDAVGPAQNGVGTQFYPRASVYNDIYLDQLPDGTWDANGRIFNFTSVFPNGFSPYFHGRITDISGTAGYKGEFENGITYDFSASYGQSTVEYTMDGSINASLGPDSPTSFFMGSLQQREMDLNADFTYPVDLGLASPLTIAVGGEHRSEAYQIGLGDEASYLAGPYTVQVLNNGTTVVQQPGTSGFPGYAPNFTTNQDRQSYAGYIDLEVDITKGLSLGIAGRYEHFSDFGSTTNGKISARYEITPWVAVRGALSTGFRAPTPGQLFTTAGITSFSGANPINSITVPASNPAAIAFGSKPLTPEKSTNISAGLVFTPGHGLNLTIDYYNIKVTDRMGFSSYTDITTDAQRQTLRAAGLGDWATVDRIRYFANGFATRTQGLDITGSYRKATDIGTFLTSIAVNYNRTRVLSRDIRMVDDVRKGNIEQSLPKWRGTLTETWTKGPFGVTARGYYYGPWVSWARPADGGNIRVRREFLADLEVHYDINDHITFAVGGENIFNNYPDKQIRGCSNSLSPPTPGAVCNWYVPTQAMVDGQRYVDSSPFGYDGGFWYVRLNARF